MSTGWVEKFDEKSGRKYFVNRESKEKKWKLPPGAFWVEKTDKVSNRKYYVHTETHAKTWNKPSEGDDGSSSTTSQQIGDWKTKHDPKTDLDYYVNVRTHQKTWINPNEDPLPDSWIKKHDPKTDRNYYVNTETKKTQWKKPIDETLPPEWRKKRDPKTGLDFYHNKVTKKSQWEDPREENPEKPESPKSVTPSDKPSAEPEEPIDRDVPEEPVPAVEEEEMVEIMVMQEVEERREIPVAPGEEPKFEVVKVKKKLPQLVTKSQAVVLKRTKKPQLPRIHYEWDPEAEEDPLSEYEEDEDQRKKQGDDIIEPLMGEEEAGAGEATVVVKPVPEGTPAELPQYFKERRERVVKGGVATSGKNEKCKVETRTIDADHPKSEAFADVSGSAVIREDAPIAKEQLELITKLCVNGESVYFPLLYSMLPYDVRTNLSGSTFSRYGRGNFLTKHPRSYMFTERESTHPLLIYFLKGEYKSFSANALNFNSALEGFTKNTLGCLPVFAKAVVEIRDFNKEVLYTEAYCQIIRALRNNPYADRTLRLWQAMVCCLKNFIPSAKFQLTMLNFLQSVIERTAVDEVEVDLVLRAKKQYYKVMGVETAGKKKKPVDKDKEKKKKKRREERKKEREKAAKEAAKAAASSSSSSKSKSKSKSKSPAPSAEGAEGDGDEDQLAASAERPDTPKEGEYVPPSTRLASACPAKTVGDLIALGNEGVGKNPQKAWERQYKTPLVSSESVRYAQYAFFLLLEGIGRQAPNGNINSHRKFEEEQVKKVLSFFKDADSYKSSISESLFLLRYVNPTNPALAPYFAPKKAQAPSLYEKESSPFFLGWLTSTPPKQLVPFGPDTDKKYGFHQEELPVPFILPYLLWRIKTTNGARTEGIFLRSREAIAEDAEPFERLTEAFSKRDFNAAKEVSCTDPHYYAAVLQDWLYNLPVPILQYSAEMDSLLDDAPFKHTSPLNNLDNSNYTKKQVECAKFCKEHTSPLQLMVMKYLMRFFRIFLEPQFTVAEGNNLTLGTLATGLSAWLFGAAPDFVAAATVDRRSKAKERKSKAVKAASSSSAEGAAAAEKTKRTREQKKAIYVLNLLLTLLPNETEEELFASLDDYAEQFDKATTPI